MDLDLNVLRSLFDINSPLFASTMPDQKLAAYSALTAQDLLAEAQFTFADWLRRRGYSEAYVKERLDECEMMYGDAIRDGDMRLINAVCERAGCYLKPLLEEEFDITEEIVLQEHNIEMPHRASLISDETDIQDLLESKKSFFDTIIVNGGPDRTTWMTVTVVYGIVRHLAFTPALMAENGPVHEVNVDFAQEYPPDIVGALMRAWKSIPTHALIYARNILVQAKAYAEGWDPGNDFADLKGKDYVLSQCTGFLNPEVREVKAA